MQADNENDDDNENGDDDDDAFCSEHTLALRQALAHCQRIIGGAALDSLARLLRAGQDAGVYDSTASSSEIVIVREAVQAARCLKRCRQEYLDEIIINNNAARSAAVDVDVVPDLSRVSRREFQQRYLVRNRPCLVRRGGVRQPDGGDGDCFAEAQRLWTTKTTATATTTATTTSTVASSTNNEKIACAINRDWFRAVLGQDTLVPVRYQQQQHLSDGGAADEPKTAELDEDGRAVECETKQLKLSDWLLLLDQPSEEPAPSLAQATTATDDASNGTSSHICTRHYYYLKDWHLQSWLERKQHRNNENTDCALAAETLKKLYSVPDHFQMDLLNDFLLRFTQGDYRFVYWGPAGSRTALHSDVMNSYSWSYNVHGVKDWTFFLPDSSGQTLCLRQRAGELVFVPATWKHFVVNVEETLSINHNWITTCNLDLVWECIVSEIGAVDAELQSWGLDGWEAKENMLRGCLGLDVSAFFLMCLTRGLDLLQQQQCKSSLSYEDCFDLVRLYDTLAVALDNPEIALEERLEASLNDKALSLNAVELAKTFIQVVKVMIDSSY